VLKNYLTSWAVYGAWAPIPMYNKEEPQTIKIMDGALPKLKV
jgi:hypothetical protein